MTNMQCLSLASGNAKDDFVFGRCNFAGVLLMSFDCILVDVIGDNEDDSLIVLSEERASVVLGSL